MSARRLLLRASVALEAMGTEAGPRRDAAGWLFHARPIASSCGLEFRPRMRCTCTSNACANCGRSRGVSSVSGAAWRGAQGASVHPSRPPCRVAPFSSDSGAVEATTKEEAQPRKPGDGRGEDGSVTGRISRCGAFLVSKRTRYAAAPVHADMVMVFTCAVCDTRSVKTMSRIAFERGVVIATCPGCQKQHVIADRLGWFGEPGSAEDFLREKGEQSVRISVDGDINLTPADLMGWSRAEEVRQKLGLPPGWAQGDAGVTKGAGRHGDGQ